MDHPPQNAAEQLNVKRWATAALGLVALAYVVWVLCLPNDTFWAGDMGVKLLQVQSILRHHFTRLALDYPGQAIDPEGAYFPITKLFAARRGGQWYAVFPPLFPALSALAFACLGYVGLYALPLASSVLLLYLTLQLARRTGIGPHAIYLPVLLGLGSPVFLYSVVFWGHAPASCLCLIGFVLGVAPADASHRSWRAVAAGSAIGLACALRPECYWFAAACVVACIWPGRCWCAALGLAVGALALCGASWVFNAYAFGHPLGLHYVLNVQHRFGASESLASHAAQAASNAAHMLLNPSTDRVVNTWVLIPLALFVAACWSGRRRLVSAAGWLTLPTLVALAADPHLKEGMFAVSPIVVFWLAGRQGSSPRGESGLMPRAAMVVAVFVLGVIATSPTAGGWQFGPRLLLPAYPLLALFSVKGMIAVRERIGTRMVVVVFFGCVLVGLVTAFQALHLAQATKINWRRLEQEFRKLESKVVVTDRPYLPQSLASLYYEKRFFLLRGDDATDLLNRLAAAGVKRFLFVSNAAHIRFAPERARGFRALAEGRRRTFMETTTFREYEFAE